MNSESETHGEVVSLEDYKKRRVEVLKKRLRLTIVKTLNSHGGQGHCNKHNIYYRILGSDTRCPECVVEEQ